MTRREAAQAGTRRGAAQAGTLREALQAGTLREAPRAGTRWEALQAGTLREAPRAGTRWEALRAAAASVAVGVGCLFVIGGGFGPVIGPLVGIGCYWWLIRQPSRAQVAAERRARSELPFAADLLSAALRAGCGPGAAAGCVAQALAGPLGERLTRVERALVLGAPPAEAWSYLGEIDGARRLVAAACRSHDSGAALAGALARVADDLRGDALRAAEAAAARAGVLIVLPLGICFLPAFILAGLVPVIIAVLGGVLAA